MEIKVGDRFTTNKGGDVVVVEYANTDNIWVEFCDEFNYRVKVQKAALQVGSVKNPYAPMLFGVGYFGVGEYSAATVSCGMKYVPTSSYRTWANMLSRCYDRNYIAPHLYSGVSVDSDWHNYQVFAEWYTNEVKRLDLDGRIYLDKDILTDESIYSKDNCCLVPNVVNQVVRVLHKGRHLQGVYDYRDKFRVVAGYDVSNNYYYSEMDAHIAFIEAKVNRIKQVAVEYKDQITPEVFNALMTRDFRYKFSPLFEPEPKVTLH